MTPVELVLGRLRERGCDPKPSGKGWAFRCLCPLHKRGDKRPSGCLGEGEDGRALLWCGAGGRAEDIAPALGLEIRELFPNGDRPPRTKQRHSKKSEPPMLVDAEIGKPWPVRIEGEVRTIAAVYDYDSAAGAVIARKVRIAIPELDNPKTFRWVRPDGAGGWYVGLGETKPSLFNLPDVLDAVKNEKRIYICAGEKDELAVADADPDRLDYAATTPPDGEGKPWKETYSHLLAGARHVTIIRDEDETGKKHAAAVYRALHGIVQRVDIVRPKEGKDAHDHLAAGFGLEDFVPVAVEEPADNKRRHIVLEPRSLIGVLDPEAGKVPHLIEPLLPRDEFSLIAAAWKSGKTLSLYQLVLGAVFGGEIFGLFEVPDPIATAVYQLELPGYEDDRRFRRICIGMGEDPERIMAAERAGFLTTFNRPPGLNLFKHPGQTEDVIEACRKCGARLVIFDSLLKLFAGLDFNDNSAVSDVCDATIKPLTAAGLTVVGLHHHSKTGMDNRTDDKVALLGAQAWGASAGRIYTLRRVPATRIRRQLQPGEFYAELRLTGSWTPTAFEPLLFNVVDDGEGTLVRAEKSPADVLEETAADRQERIVLTLLERQDLSKTTAKKYGLTGGTYDRVLQRARDRGWIEGTTRARHLTRAGHAELDRRRDRLGELELE